ncbi:MAG TPA: hypothetical protein VGP46_00380, partial [Acidimicrobiales bacterium]|nr:hypothetical protein [Acidimicrobiales bacterium]
MSLRLRLVLIPLLLAAVALGVIETITYVKIRETLIANVDEQLQSSTQSWKQYLRANLLNDRHMLPSFGNVQPYTVTAFYQTNGQLLPLP